MSWVVIKWGPGWREQRRVADEIKTKQKEENEKASGETV